MKFYPENLTRSKNNGVSEP